MTIVEALKNLYEAMGGEAESVKNFSLNSEMVNAIAELVESGGGGLPDVTDVPNNALLMARYKGASGMKAEWSSWGFYYPTSADIGKCLVIGGDDDTPEFDVAELPLTLWFYLTVDGVVSPSRFTYNQLKTALEAGHDVKIVQSAENDGKRVYTLTALEWSDREGNMAYFTQPAATGGSQLKFVALSASAYMATQD